MDTNSDTLKGHYGLQGMTERAAIAERLHLAPGTVRNYVSTIIEKLEVADRTQAAIIAMKASLVKRNY